MKKKRIQNICECECECECQPVSVCVCECVIVNVKCEIPKTTINNQQPTPLAPGAYSRSPPSPIPAALPFVLEQSLPKKKKRKKNKVINLSLHTNSSNGSSSYLNTAARRLRPAPVPIYGDLSRHSGMACSDFPVNCC